MEYLLGVCTVEFLLINQNKLKIVLNEKEVKEYGLEGGDAAEDPSMRDVFFRILDKARESVGFSTLSDRALIQFYPSAAGAEIFVTKLGRMTPAREKSLASSNLTMLSSKLVAYRFSLFSDLVAAAKQVQFPVGACCAVYYCDDGSYYLIFEQRCAHGAIGDGLCICEYAEEVAEMLIPYIIEHGSSVKAGDVISELRSLSKFYK